MFDNHLKFDKHISLLCTKANRKLSALATILHKISETDSSFHVK